MYCVFELLVELADGGISCLEDHVLDVCEIMWSLLQLDSALGNEVSSGDGFSECWYEVCGFCKVKREEGFKAVSYVVW